MSWTKKQLVEQACVEIGLSYSFDLTPEQQQTAMVRLDSMMAYWETKGIYLGYALPDEQLSGDLDDDSNVDIRANEAIYSNLAVRFASTIGKMVSPDTKMTAKNSFNELLARATIAPDTQPIAGTPAGSGNKGIEFLDCPSTTTIDKTVLDLT